MKVGHADFWSGLALGALAAYVIVQASGWDYMGPDGPGPGFFPLWYGAAMAALSCETRAPERAQAASAPKTETIT